MRTVQWCFTTGVVYFSRSPDTTTANQTRAQSISNTLSEDPGHNPSIKPYNPYIPTNKRQKITTTTTTTTTTEPTRRNKDAESEFSLHVPIRAAVSQPAPFSLPLHLTTEKPAQFHFITKPYRTNQSITTEELTKTDATSANYEEVLARRPIVPTTYSPPKFFLKSILPTTSSTTSEPLSTSTTEIPEHAVNKPQKALKYVRKISPDVETPTSTEYSRNTNKEAGSASASGGDYNVQSSPYRRNKHVNKYSEVTSSPATSTTVTSTTTAVPTTVPTKTTTTTTTIQTTTTQATVSKTSTYKIDEEYVHDRLISRYTTEGLRNQVNGKRFRNTVEVPPADQLLYNPEDLPKSELDEPPSYKPKPVPKSTTPDNTAKTVADSPRNNTTVPPRTSRVNAAIKSLIATGGARRPNTKCNDNQTPNVNCNDPKQRYLFLN